MSNSPEAPGSFLRYVPPMGIYQTLYAFLESFGVYMGEAGTHPWSQGFPRTDRLPGGPAMPTQVQVEGADLMYPKAYGLPALRAAIADYYCRYYGASVAPENIMVFAGGRPALVATLLFLQSDIEVRIAETEYTPYYDMLNLLQRNYSLVPSHVENGFCATLADYLGQQTRRQLLMLSNPCNPTGITRGGSSLQAFVKAATGNTGLLIDEAYEMFHQPPVSALQYVDDIDQSQVFVVGAATKGLQAPGIRVGWVVAARHHIEVLSNFSSFAMGGVSQLSQRYALALLQPERVEAARRAVPGYYGMQRQRYGEAFLQLGLELYSGEGGFYHWCRLPEGLTAEALNQKLFSAGAAILKGSDCDMARRGKESPLASFMRFSFGPLPEESFAADVKILAQALSS